MEEAYKEEHRYALKKIVNWQTILLLAMGLFYIAVLLLFLGEVFTTSYMNNGFYTFVGLVCLGLAWTAYIWFNLLGTVRAARAYLRSAKEEDLERAYLKQRLFWRNITIIAGLFVGLLACIFLLVMITSGGRF